jgi:cell division protein FtsQ
MLALFPVAVVAGVSYAAVQSPLLTAQSFSVQGAETLDTQAVIEISGLKGRSLLDLPEADARARLMEVPQIKSVSISRTFPQKVTIRVEERQPAAYWSVNNREYVVDADGYVLNSGVPASNAPRIVEPDSTRVMGPGDRVHPDAVALALRLLEESPRVLNQNLATIEYRQDVGVSAVFANGMRVTFGDERSYDYKMAVLTRLLDRLTTQGVAAPRAVDLRFGERVTYE